MSGFTIYARVKKAGRQRRESLEALPYRLAVQPKTVREMIAGLAEQAVLEYNERRDSGQILSCLTREAIDEKADAGKITFDLRGGNDADSKKAVESAIQSFEDGIYRIFAGEKELTGLEESIPWENDLVFTFVRLTMISGCSIY